MTFTTQQIANWRAYERVRKSGQFSMFSPQALAESGLSKDEYIFCVQHYSALQTAALGEAA